MLELKRFCKERPMRVPTRAGGFFSSRARGVEGPRIVNGMSPESVRALRRGTCLFLSLLLLFLSYKPATALLAIAGAAKNPTEGRRPCGLSDVDVRENLPRPAKKQQRETQGRLVQKIQKSWTVSPQEKELLKQHFLGGGLRHSGSSLDAASKGEETSATPDYLKLFLPASPGSPHSPPA